MRPTEEQIEASKKASVAAYNKRKDESRRRKEGVKFIHENRIPLMKTFLRDGSTLLIGFQKVTEENGVTTIQFAYSLCSPNDQWSDRVGKGILGSRLKSPEENDKFVFALGLKDCDFTDRIILRVGQKWLETCALLKEPFIPDRMAREAHASLAKEEKDWGDIEFFNADIKR